ncbi:MAG: hypothetical protein PHF57_07785, partial [Methanoregula sp.]|nr:hypothetical protein [Methanoregula sp.]
GELLFNAIVWATGTRMWGASKELTEVMRKPNTGLSEVTWETVELLMPGSQVIVWSYDEGTSSPLLNEEADPDDLCPEDIVTKQFWKNLYQGIELWRNDSKKLK